MNASPVAVLLAALALSLSACDFFKRDETMFRLVPPSETGVSFANTITTSDSLSVLTDPYVYNGAGVGVGDIDNDGLPDLFFAGNQVSSRLYLNKGGLRFEDVTDRAGVRTNRWATGVAMVDINNDGYLDIYVSVSGPPGTNARDRANLLFVNNGNRTFTESASRYGIADTGFTTQAAFLDYDRDGCLDLFLLENSPRDFSRNAANEPMGLRGKTPGSYDELYHNNCNGTFTNVSQAAGILRDPGFGLGVAVDDLNGDGWPDIYVSNDIQPNDVVYVNNGNGTFTNRAAAWLKHSSYAGMGVDIADFNDDGWPDILQADMLPHDPSRYKRVSGFLTYAGLLDNRRQGFRDDYSVNSLQLNNGVTRDGDVIFSEISRMAGVSRTDWSWSALFADLDNDGRKDIFISNGYPKAVIDLDYQSTMRAAQRGGAAGARHAHDILSGLPAYEVPNYAFRNDGDLTFADVSRPWGMGSPSLSYGAAYADLDNDGRLDLVVNNIDAPAFVYHNVGRGGDTHHFLRVKLEGEKPNTRGIGTTLLLTAAGHRQRVYQSPYRGYMSSVDDRVHFGLGAARAADSLTVVWPDGRSQILLNLPADREVVVRQADAVNARSSLPASRATERPFQPLDPLRAPTYVPPPLTLVDYSVQSLLPYMLSRHGPPIAVGDANGDGLEDVFIGGGNGVPGALFIQQKSGGFLSSRAAQPWRADSAYDDWGAVFFDANGDGRLDLYVTSGGYQLVPGSGLLQDRLYVNQGNGAFSRDSAALPEMLASKGVVRAGDFNGDGRPDLFVAGRLTPRAWPTPTRSYILRNDGGRFTDVTEQIAPQLVHPGGMVTDAAWVDFDGDGRLDLVTVGEWMPIQFFRNDGHRLVDVTGETRLPLLRGWWFSLGVGDFDHDGRPDLIAGNLGLNFTYTTSAASRFGVYAGDFTGNRSADIVLTQEDGGTEYPIAGLARLGREIYPLTIRFPTFGAFADASIVQAFDAAQLKSALHLQADTFASVYLHNEGQGRWAISALPRLAQIAPIRAIVVTDVDGDGNLDAIVAGNLYDVEANTPRADAGNGLWLRGDGKGHFSAVSPSTSGLLAPHDVSGLTLVDTPVGRVLLVGNTGDSLQAFTIRKRLNR